MDQPHIEMVLEADFLGRLQTLTLDEAELRLLRSLRKREAALASPEDDQEPGLVIGYWKEMGYRSVAYDAAGLTTTMAREFPEQEYAILPAHMELMRSMLDNAEHPNVNPLFELLTELKNERGCKEREG